MERKGHNMWGIIFIWFVALMMIPFQYLASGKNKKAAITYGIYTSGVAFIYTIFTIMN